MKTMLEVLKFRNVKRIILLFGLSFLIISSALIGQKADSHLIFDQKMKKSNYKKMIKACNSADVILFGEIHSDPISHWLQLKLIKELARKHDIEIGLEMFEKDNQEALSNFVENKSSIEELTAEARLWNNFETDYLPILEFAKSSKIKCLASNIPRTYASLVYNEGFEILAGLVDEEKKFIAPLPIPYDSELSSYKKMLNMVEGHAGENFPKAQAIKDATMAHSITENWEVGKKIIHLNGSFHSDDFQGISWYLNKYKPELKIVTISSVQSNLQQIDITSNKGKADFIILIDEEMTQTYK